MKNIYDPGFVEKLFDEMAGTYAVVNYVSSFGFSSRWRKQFVANANITPGMTVCDLMCGMGECWQAIAASLGGRGAIYAIDLSAAMLKGAEKQIANYPEITISLDKQNALCANLEDKCADCITCGFGIKTMTPEQMESLAKEMNRLLKPNGTFSIIEVSTPPIKSLKIPYLFYLKKLVPVIGRLFLGNPENYRMLGIYTEKFNNCQAMLKVLSQQGFAVKYHTYFYGCATGISGMKLGTN